MFANGMTQEDVIVYLLSALADLIGEDDVIVAMLLDLDLTYDELEILVDLAGFDTDILLYYKR